MLIEKNIQREQISVFGMSRSKVRKIGFIGLEVIFFSIVAAVAHIRQVSFNLEPWFIILFMLATFRAARTISFNEITASLREPFTFVKRDSCGAGANVHPRSGGIRYVIGSLIACPICTGTWCALVLFSLYVIYQPIGIVLVYVLAFAGGSEIIHYIAEYFEWGARKNRVTSGSISPDKE